jgi:uncharacterized Zn finger protein (UPF0148 family)
MATSRRYRLLDHECRDCGSPCFRKGGRCKYCGAAHTAATRKTRQPRKGQQRIPFGR